MQFHDFTKIVSSPASEAGVKPGVTPSLHFGDEHFILSCVGSDRDFPIIAFLHFKTLIVISSMQFDTGNFYVGC